MAAASAIALGVIAVAAVGSAVVANEAAIEAKTEAGEEKTRQKELKKEAQGIQDKQSEITSAETIRLERKKKARKTRSTSGGGFLTGGDTGLANNKQTLGE